MKNLSRDRRSSSIVNAPDINLALKAKKNNKEKKVVQIAPPQIIRRASINKRASVNENFQNDLSSDPRMNVNPDEELPPRFLYPADPNETKNQVTFNYWSKKPELTDELSQLTIHFELKSCFFIKESDEHKQQEEIQDERIKELREVMKNNDMGDYLNYDQQESNGENVRLARKILRNKFNYSEIGTQSAARDIREKGISTSKPNLLSFSGEVNQVIIYRSYINAAKIEVPEKIKELGLEVPKTQNKTVWPSNPRSLLSALKIMERLIIQNTQENAYNDYRYLYSNSASNKIIENSNKASLVHPLWRFTSDVGKGANVTGIKWNPRYPDLFAASFGSYIFGRKPQNPRVSLFSLKNPSFPEREIPLEECPTCIDFHPTLSSLIAVGLDNGTVMVFDIKSNSNAPLYRSSLLTGQHTDTVWEIKWSSDIHKPHFFSIGSDGLVLDWWLNKEKLDCEEVFRLKYVERGARKGDKIEEGVLNALASGLCFDFSTFDGFRFLVGTEEGNIHCCSRAYTGEYQFTFDGHSLAVYRVRFSPFKSDIFISASEDWTIKVWKLDFKQAIMTFDLGESVVDIAWSPFSSSVFVALSLEKAHFFNLETNRYGEVESIRPTDRKCTNLAFNWKDPILLIGDVAEGISTFKLATIFADPKRNISSDSERQNQIGILSKCLELGSMID